MVFEILPPERLVLPDEVGLVPDIMSGLGCKLDGCHGDALKGINRGCDPQPQDLEVLVVDITDEKEQREQDEKGQPD